VKEMMMMMMIVTNIWLPRLKQQKIPRQHRLIIFHSTKISLAGKYFNSPQEFTVPKDILIASLLQSYKLHTKLLFTCTCTSNIPDKYLQGASSIRARRTGQSKLESSLSPTFTNESIR
jgi:hypothetical protein